MSIVTRSRTNTALLLLLLTAVSALQTSGTITNVSADSTLTIQLTRAAVSTDPPSASGTVQINLNTGQLSVELNQATADSTYTSIFVSSPPSAILQLGSLDTDSGGSGTVQANLSGGTYTGIFEITKVGFVQYSSTTASFTIEASGSTSNVTTTLSQTSTVTAQSGNTVSANNTNSLTLQIQPPSDTITAGTFAKFDMHIVGNSAANIFLVARGVPPDSVAIFTPNVGVATRDFLSSLTIVTSADTPAGNYAVTAVAIVNGRELTSQVSLQILAPTGITTSANATTRVSLGTTLTMTVTTDQPQYQPNSTVTIQGQVTDSTGSAVAGVTVSVQVDASTGSQLFFANNLQTDAAGIFQTQVSLPPSSPTGTYTVFTSATKSGYSSVTTRTTFVVGTSSTPSVIIKAVYAGDSAGNPTSTFTEGQTIWIWVVIENIGVTFQGVVWIQVRDPNGVPVQIQIHISQLDAGGTIKDGLGFTLVNHPIGVYTVNALVSDKLISQGGTFLASADAQFALID